MTELATAPDAPYGLKKDGTPRQRPAPAWMNDPAKLAAAVAKRKRPRARNGHTNGTAVAVAREPELLVRIVRELDAQIVDATAAVDRCRAELEAAEARRAHLVAGRDAIRA